jgi:anti-sigma factor RsiW
MACEQWRKDLDRSLDGELSTAEGEVLAAHLRTCAACSAEVLEHMHIKRALHIAGKRFTPTAEFRNKITKSVTAKSKCGMARRLRFVLIPALALLIAAIFLNAHAERERTARQHIYSQLADLHIATLASGTPVAVVSSDRHTVKPWFQGRIPFTFNLPKLEGTEFALLGGRVFYLDQTPGAHLIYQIRKHEISVFILPDRASEIKNLPSGIANNLSFNMDTWAQNGLRYLIVGDTNADDIRALAMFLQNAK